MSARRVIALVAIGLLAGAMATLLGVGGGAVIVPLLLIVLRVGPREATATSLAAITIISAVGVATHGVFGHVAWGRAILIGVPAVAGVIAGVALKNRLPVRALTLGFAVVLVLIAMTMLVGGPGHAEPRALTVAVAFAAAAIGVAAGCLAGLFGVGGGVLFVPALTLILGLTQRLAVGTSLLAVVIVSSVGTWRQRRNGTIRWRAAAIMGTASIVTSLVGAHLSRELSAGVLRDAFSLLLVLTAVHLAVGAIRRPGRRNGAASVR